MAGLAKLGVHLMGLITTLSFGIVDYSGKRKTIPLRFPAATSEADLQDAVDDLSPLIDAVIDGKIVDVYVTKALVLPGGLKAAAINGNRCREGALLKFDAASTNYQYDLFIPSWENAGFTGDTVLDTGDYGALQLALVQGGNLGAGVDPSDEYGNDLLTFLGGERTFRK